MLRLFRRFVFVFLLFQPQQKTLNFPSAHFHRSDAFRMLIISEQKFETLKQINNNNFITRKKKLFLFNFLSPLIEMIWIFVLKMECDRRLNGAKQRFSAVQLDSAFFCVLLKTIVWIRENWHKCHLFSWMLYFCVCWCVCLSIWMPAIIQFLFLFLFSSPYLLPLCLLHQNLLLLCISVFVQRLCCVFFFFLVSYTHSLYRLTIGAHTQSHTRNPKKKQQQNAWMLNKPTCSYLNNNTQCFLLAPRHHNCQIFNRTPPHTPTWINPSAKHIYTRTELSFTWIVLFVEIYVFFH